MAVGGLQLSSFIKIAFSCEIVVILFNFYWYVNNFVVCSKNCSWKNQKFEAKLMFSGSKVSQAQSKTHSLTAALDHLRFVASSTSNDPGPRSRQHQQIGQCLLPLVAANFFVDDRAGASSQRREECWCGLLLTVAVPDSNRSKLK